MIKSRNPFPNLWGLREKLNEFMSKLPEEERYRIKDVYQRIWAALYHRLGRSPLPRFLMLGEAYLRGYIPRRGDVVIDVGAYTGDTALIFSRLVGEEGRVIAFEPDDYNFRKLQANIDNLHLKNVTAVKRALWSENRIMRFAELHGIGSSLLLPDRYRGGWRRIRVARLDDEVRRLNLDRVDFIKIDAEGAEIEILKGAKRTLEESAPSLAIAAYHEVKGKQTWGEVNSILKKMGYKTKIIFWPEIVVVAWKKGQGRERKSRRGSGRVRGSIPL